MAVSLHDKAKAVLANNDRGGYTIPTESLYPFQWNWDSALVALGFATYDQDRAWREIETLFESQWDDGLVPHIVFHAGHERYFPGPSVWCTNTNPPTSGITQPPVAASVVRMLWKMDDSKPFRERLEAIFPKLVAWHRWFHRIRDPLKKGLVLTVHPWESGRDNSPEWDKAADAVETGGVGAYQRQDLKLVDNAMRPTNEQYDQYLALVEFGRQNGWAQEVIAKTCPFQVFDLGCTMILLRAERDLLSLAGLLGEAAVAAEARERIERTENAIDYLWDDASKTFCSRDHLTGELSGFVTSASFLAFYAGIGTDAQRGHLIDHLERIDRASRYLLPSFDPEQPAFDSLRYWRGPVWAVVNYLVSMGFTECGLDDWAQRLRSDTGELIKLTGFSENFCPLTGAAAGGGDFSWTAAMWLAWAGE